MSILEHDVRTRREAEPTGRQFFRFSRDQYHAMADLGAFEGRRVELIEGEIVEMPPFGDEHASVSDPLSEMLRAIFGLGYAVRTQVPIALGDDYSPSEPEPDVAVAIGNWQDYRGRKPRPEDLKLVIEIAQTSLRDDRLVKAPLYGAAGILEYWILNLVDRQLEVYRNPYAAGYKSMTVYTTTDAVEPLAAPGQSIRIADILL